MIARNFISFDSKIIPVRVLYPVNSITITFINNLRQTMEHTSLVLTFGNETKVPMDAVNITIDFNNGTVLIVTQDFPETMVLPVVMQYDVEYATQGFYNVTAQIQNVLTRVVNYQYIRVWDNLDAVEIKCLSNCSYLITNQSIMTTEFSFVPRSGFNYTINFGDGEIVQNTDDSLLYLPYNLSSFSHIYTNPGVYLLVWTAWNDQYFKTNNFTVTIQNALQDFQVCKANEICAQTSFLLFLLRRIQSQLFVNLMCIVN